MKQFLTLIVLLIAGCIIAALYGIIHDQLTYTISPEYYTKFKFYQFGLVDEGSTQQVDMPRLWVSVVGILATWWMGIPISLIIGIFSIHRDIRIMIALALKGMMVTMVVAFITGLYGLYIGFAYFAHQPIDTFHRKYIPANLVDQESFIAVGSMHNHSYQGGAIGLFVAVAYIVFMRGVIKTRRSRPLHLEK